MEDLARGVFVTIVIVVVLAAAAVALMLVQINNAPPHGHHDDINDSCFDSSRFALEDSSDDNRHTTTVDKTMDESEGNKDKEIRKERVQELLRDKLVGVEVEKQPTYKVFIEYSFANLQVAPRDVAFFFVSVPPPPIPLLS